MEKILSKGVVIGALKFVVMSSMLLPMLKVYDFIQYTGVKKFKDIFFFKTP
jgi:hypothetical protein